MPDRSSYRFKHLPAEAPAFARSGYAQAGRRRQVRIRSLGGRQVCKESFYIHPPALEKSNYLSVSEVYMSFPRRFKPSLIILFILMKQVQLSRSVIFLIGLLLSAPLLLPIPACAVMLGNVTGYAQNGNKITIDCGGPKVRIEAWTDDLIRIWLSNNGSFNYFNTYNSFMIQPGLDTFKGPAALTVTDVGYIKIQTGDLVVRVEKSPFRLLFYKSDNTTLITCNPPGQSLDTNYKAYFKRDAAGVTEHFFGLNGPGKTGPEAGGDRYGSGVPLDKRNLTIVTYDQMAGDGWACPFFMSTAGYGVFFNNEFSWQNQFTFNDPIVIENTGKPSGTLQYGQPDNGQLDLFFIYGPDFRDLLDKFTGLTGKPPIPPRKFFGFNYNVAGTPVYYQGAFPTWRSRGYPIDNDITFTDYNIVSNDIHVSNTADSIHTNQGACIAYYDLNTPGTFRDGSEPNKMAYPYSNWTAFKTTVRTRTLDKKVDWFWLDEVESYVCSWPFYLMKSFCEAMESYDSRRGWISSRGGYTGCQRFGYPWMGDINYGQPVGNGHRIIISSLTSGLSGVPHSTHDMSGADVEGVYDGRTPMAEDEYIRGVKVNLLNPVTQCTDWISISGGKPGGMVPWMWSIPAQGIFLKYLKLHYRFVPYWYSMAWQAHTTGIPDWRALVIDYPNDPNVYNSDMVMIGDNLLMAPLYSSNTRDVYLPAGKWYFYFDNSQSYTGNQTLTGYAVTNTQLPLFVKAGAIIPMQPDMNYIGEKAVDPLTLDIYPYGTSSFTLYEDDGVTRNYQSGAYCTTKYDCLEAGNSVRFTINARSGSYAPASRNYLLAILENVKPLSVAKNGADMVEYTSQDSLNRAAEGWGFFRDSSSNSYRVNVKFADNGGTFVIVLTMPGTPVVSATGIKPERFAFSAGTVRADGRLQVCYEIPSTASQKVITVQLYNLEGRLLRTLLDARQVAAGNHTMSFDLSGLTEGQYLLRMTAKGFEKSVMVSFIK